MRKEHTKSERKLTIKRPVGYFQSTSSTENPQRKKGRTADIQSDQADENMDDMKDKGEGTGSDGQTSNLDFDGLNLHDNVST